MRFSRGGRWFLPVAVFALAVGVWGAALVLRTARAGERFDFVRWEIEALPGKTLYALGAPFRAGPPGQTDLGAYFDETDRSSPLARRLENAVEAVIEARIAAVLAEQGIHWPPVDFELAASPRVLIVSPRTRIERIVDDPLRPDLTTADVERIEAAAERDRTQSALVVRTGGVATYPAIVLEGGDYRETVSAAAHEWAHHYLTFHPLGRAYFASADARTINETVADIVGDEVAHIVVERWGLPARPGQASAPPPAAPAAPAAPVPPRPGAVDAAQALRALRLDVDALLTVGRVEDAERRMAAVREELAAAGIRYRRINQAFFAWTGSYAARADAVDALGGQLRALRARAGSVARFLAAVQPLRTRAEVARVAPPPATEPEQEEPEQEEP